MDSATAYNKLDELQKDLVSAMVDADGNPTVRLDEAGGLFITIKEEIGKRDPRLVAYAALTLATWAIGRIQH